MQDEKRESLVPSPDVSPRWNEDTPIRLPDDLWGILPAGLFLLIFLVLLRFTPRFGTLPHYEHWLSSAAVLAAIASLVSCCIPVAQRWLDHLFRRRMRHSAVGDRVLLVAQGTLAAAVIVTAHVLVTETVGIAFGVAVSLFIAFVIGAVASRSRPG